MIDKGRIEINLDREFPNEKTILDFLQNGQLYEPDVFHAFVRVLEKGDRVFDVGANIGFFTLLSAALVGPEGAVVSFEPDAENIKRLSANIDLNGLNNVTTIERPASDKVEQVGFYINSDNSGGNALWDPALFPGNDESKANPKRLDMQTTTLAERKPGRSAAAISN
ncbi:MAG: FkbM family methyltransferase [Rhodospirillales bacterium]|nr:FkbM family methyltransferase [Rhodospirillales bacterium]